MSLGIVVFTTNLINHLFIGYPGNQIWEEYKINFNKSYQSPEEEKKREDIFMRNFKTIALHNLNYEVGLTTFTQNLNEFTDKDMNEIVAFSGTENRTEMLFDKTNKNFTKFSFDPNMKIPESFDWKDRNAVTSVKHQKECGSCYAFAALDAIESNIYLKTGEMVDLSEQEIVDCGRGYGMDSCDGGYIFGVFNYIQNNEGISLEENYPYRAHKQTCQKSIRKYNYNIKRIIELYSNKGNEEYLQQALVKYGPIATYIHHSHESFKSYSSGIYYEPNCKSKSTTHVVLLVGYGSENGLDYWTIKNSMGAGWGEKGFMRIVRNKNNHCGIASYPYVIDNEE